MLEIPDEYDIYNQYINVYIMYTSHTTTFPLYVYLRDQWLNQL